MATASDEQQHYEGGGGGGGGKFRKRPLRQRVHRTPYDRPPIPANMEFRNPNGGGGGWLSKLVDPAQRLIAYGAHRLFSSVFRKRLAPPEPSFLLPDTNLEAKNKQQEAGATDFLGVQKESFDQRDGPIYSASSSELTDLEQVLKQKTFTRYEIDRLTALLQSRTVDLAIEDKGKRPEVVPLKEVVSTDREEGFPRTPAPGNRMEREAFPKSPAPENRIENQLVSTPVVNSTVFEGSVASPTELVELAKSYMHKKPMSPSMLGFRNQATVENSTAMNTRNLNSPSRLPFTPLVPRITLGNAEARENGFITPRSRGRSAIYSMARTPYSRVYPTNASKGVENTVDIYGGASSSSQYTRGAVKRRSSVLENDIGSFGAIRRIRQKPNLLSSRGLTSPGGSIPLPSSGIRLDSEAAHNPPSSRLKSMSFGEPLCNTIKPSAEDGDNCMPNTTVPSKSSEIASKILQQLDKLVSPKDKPFETKVLALMGKLPSKLSPSMLRGQDLKSLEHVDSSKFLGDVQHDKMIDGSPNRIVANGQGSTSQEQDKVKENGHVKLGSAIPKENGKDSSFSKEDGVLETSFPAASNSLYPPQKKRAFQMSANEDVVDLDEDGLPNGTVSELLAEGRGKVNLSLAESKNTATEFFKPEQALDLTEIKPVASEIDRKTDFGTSGSITAEKSSNLIFQNASSPSTSVFPSIINTDSSVSPPAFNIGGKIVSTKDANGASPTCNFGLKSAEKPPGSQVTFSTSSTVSFVPSDPKPETSSNLLTKASGATDSLTKLPEPDKADSKGNETVPPSSSSTSTANALFFSSTPTLKNVSLMNEPSTSASPTLAVFNTLPSQNSSGSGNNLSSSNQTPSVSATSVFTSESSALTTTVAPFCKTTASVVPGRNFPVRKTPPVPAASVFNFSTPTVSTASALAAFACTPVSETSNKALKAINTNQDASFSNLRTSLATTTSTSSPLFGFTATATSTSASQSLGDQSLLAGTGVMSFPQIISGQFGSSASSPTFGLAGSTTSASASSLFGSTLGAKPFILTSSPGLGSSSTEANLSSSSSSSTSSVFGSSWPQQKSPIFSFAASPSTVFSFTASSTSSAATTSSPSTGFSLASNSSPSNAFSFGSSSASKAAANGSVTAGFSFGSLTPNATTNSSPSTGFTLGESSASFVSSSSPFGLSAPPTLMNGSPTAFGPNSAASSSSPFTFSSPSATAPTQSLFGNPSARFAFSSSHVNNDQMSTEDTMAEDTAQASALAASAFGQPQPISQSPSAFTFGNTAPAPAVGNPFQFASLPNPANPQNPSPFQATGSLGSNFSMGSGGSGVDKSNRKYVKVKHKLRKK